MASSTSRTFPVLGLAWPLLVLGLMAAFDVTISPASPKPTHIPGRLTYDGKPVSHSRIAWDPPANPMRSWARSVPSGRTAGSRSPRTTCPGNRAGMTSSSSSKSTISRWHKQGGFEAMGTRLRGRRSGHSRVPSSTKDSEPVHGSRHIRVVG